MYSPVNFVLWICHKGALSCVKSFINMAEYLDMRLMAELLLLTFFPFIVITCCLFAGVLICSCLFLIKRWCSSKKKKHVMWCNNIYFVCQVISVYFRAILTVSSIINIIKHNYVVWTTVTFWLFNTFFSVKHNLSKLNNFSTPA